MTLKLFLLIKLTHQILLEEKNSGELSLSPLHFMVWMWRNDFQDHLSGSFKFAHFNYPAMCYVTICQFLKCFAWVRNSRTKIMYVISSPLLKVIYCFVCLSVADFEQLACWLYGMFTTCLNQPINISVNFFPFVIYWYIHKPYKM